jgi:hypothetical protein
MILGRALWKNFGHNKQQPKKGCWQVRNLDIWSCHFLDVFLLFCIFICQFTPVSGVLWAILMTGLPTILGISQTKHLRIYVSELPLWGTRAGLGRWWILDLEPQCLTIWARLLGYFWDVWDSQLWPGPMAQVPCRADQGAERPRLVAHATLESSDQQSTDLLITTICQLQI